MYPRVISNGRPRLVHSTSLKNQGFHRSVRSALDFEAPTCFAEGPPRRKTELRKSGASRLFDQTWPDWPPAWLREFDFVETGSGPVGVSTHKVKCAKPRDEPGYPPEDRRAKYGPEYLTEESRAHSNYAICIRLLGADRLRGGILPPGTELRKSSESRTFRVRT